MENREIKLRVYNPQQKQMTKVPLCEYMGFHGIVYDRVGCSNSDNIWMPYVGLEDKNDVEIYEGDILKTLTGLAVVVKDFNWGLKSVGSEAVDFEPKEYFEQCEVVGNIYENSKLL